MRDGEDFACESKNLVVYTLLNLSQCKDLRAGLMWEDFGALTMAHMREFWMC